MISSIKRMFLSAIMACAAIAQTAPVQHAWNCFPDATLTNDVYWAHQPPQVQALRNMNTVDGSRSALAMSLAKQGFIIDESIMSANWDAVCIMGQRKAEGFTWVPNALQANIPVAPGLSFPGLPSYDPNTVPAGSIKVSTDAKDYPPFTPPAPPAPPVTNLVGQCGVFGDPNTCAVNVAAMNLPSGTVVTQNGVKYALNITVGLFGKSGWFTVVK